MKERPIIFSDPMVRAILDGRKTQTRRVVNPQPGLGEYSGMGFEGEPWWYWGRDINNDDKALEYYWKDGEPSSIPYFACPYGQPGERLWVRETHQIYRPHYGRKQADEEGRHYDRWIDGPVSVRQRDGAFEDLTGLAVLYRANGSELWHNGWRPSIHMPRWASRITLEITDVRVERVQDINENDAISEGFHYESGDGITAGHLSGSEAATVKDNFPRRWFANRWNAINAKRGHGWDTNPWVWVLTFKRL